MKIILQLLWAYCVLYFLVQSRWMEMLIVLAIPLLVWMIETLKGLGEEYRIFKAA